MIDLKELQINFSEFELNILRRGKVENFQELMDNLLKRRALINICQQIQRKRNIASKHASSVERVELRELNKLLQAEQANLRTVETDLKRITLLIPNILEEAIPEGICGLFNREVRKIGIPRNFPFAPLDHTQLGLALKLLDLERAVKISGPRFAFLTGAASRLNRALIQYLCEYHFFLDDIELSAPYLVKYSAMVNAGQFPKFRTEAFQLDFSNGEPLFLIPTAEVPVTNFHACEILQEKKFPIRYFSYSPCFRSEAGAAGRDNKGLIRMHQFEKVEMVRFCNKIQAENELNEMVERVSKILSELELPHRIVLLCSGDVGFSSSKTYDIEVWLPSQTAYREISSCSMFGTFQARRAEIKFRSRDGSLLFANTLNGSALPLGRTIAAIFENNQQKDGSISIPTVLQKYMGGEKKLCLKK